MEDAGEPRGLARGRAERDDVLDLEVDRVADPHAVAQAVLRDLDRRALHAEVLADQRAQRLHRAAEHAAELLRLLVGGVRVDEDAQPPVAIAHDLRGVGHGRDGQAAHVRALDVTVGDVEDQRDPAAVVVGAERQ